MNLDVEYDNAARVDDFAGIIENWNAAAQIYRDDSENRLDIAYGDNARQKFDLFGPETKPDTPLVVFIHGGYWRALGRETFSHMATGLNKAGYQVLVPSYRLCPDAAIADIITDMRLLCAFVWRKYQRRLIITGHSAGGHLAAAMLATNWRDYDLPGDMVTAALGISGLYDLRPLLATKLNQTLHMNEQTARANSPLCWQSPVGKRFVAAVGGDESDEYLRQTQTVTACWLGAGVKASAQIMPDKNHFTMIDDLVDQDSNLTQTIIRLTRAL